MTGYFASPWPGEDAGPARLATPGPDEPKLGRSLRVTARPTLMSTMTVLGSPGEVFLLCHQALRSRLGLPTRAWVERIDPVSLRTLERSPLLPGGPMWPGGVAVHRNGDLYVVYGRFAHRLGRDLRVKASAKLPIPEPHNSFVILPDGHLALKNLSRTRPARLQLLEPDRLATVATLDCPEPSVARLSALGNDIYVVGLSSIFRATWDGTSLGWDRWRHDYAGGTAQTHGWDVVLGGDQAWFMDNGEHRYQTSMVGRGVAPTANRLIRVSLADAADHEALEVSGLPGGSITNPPLYDAQRRIIVGFDSANRFMKAWRHGETGLVPLWERAGIGCASHMILLPHSGRLVTNDYQGREAVVLLDIETGDLLVRAEVGGITQGVVFPSIGWNDDIYWCSMRRVARIF